MSKFSALTAMCLLWTIPLFAQIDINGSVDFEFSYGAQNSNFLKNEIAENYRRPHLAINQFNLFLFSDLGGDFFFNSRLQWDTWGTGKINPVRISLAMLSWEPAELPVTITLGRFVTPFGLYPRRSLASQNLFINSPLAYGYFINISDTRGFWPKAGDGAVTYGTDDVGLTTLYFGGYSTGAMFNWIIIPEGLDVSLAVTNVAPASQQDYTNLQNLGATMRVGFQPAIFWQQGMSVSYGSFMRRDVTINANYDRLEHYRQTLLGTDLILAYSYFELSGEFIYSMWKVPGSTSAGFVTTTAGDLAEFDLTNYSGYVDFKYEPSFLTGSYIALRYEKMIFDSFDQPQDTNPVINRKHWDDNISRYSVAIGYKIARPILLKVAFSDQRYDDSSLNGKYWTLRSILTISM